MFKVSISLLSSQRMLSEPCAWGVKIHEISSFAFVRRRMFCSWPTFTPNQWSLTFGPDQHDYHVAVQVITSCYCSFVCLYSYHSFIQPQLQIKSLEMFFAKHIWSNTKITLDWNDLFCICHLWENQIRTYHHIPFSSP